MAVFNKGNSSVKFDLSPPSSISSLSSLKDRVPHFALSIYPTAIHVYSSRRRETRDIIESAKSFGISQGIGSDRSGLFVGYIPQVVSFAEDEIGFRVEGRADLAESAVAASAFQAVFVPIHVQSFQEVPRSKNELVIS